MSIIYVAYLKVIEYEKKDNFNLPRMPVTKLCDIRE